nr:hypothetical protein [Tanacetum cinerariifolium]
MDERTTRSGREDGTSAATISHDVSRQFEALRAELHASLGQLQGQPIHGLYPHASLLDYLRKLPVDLVFIANFQSCVDIVWGWMKEQQDRAEKIAHQQQQQAMMFQAQFEALRAELHASLGQLQGQPIHGLYPHAVKIYLEWDPTSGTDNESDDANVHNEATNTQQQPNIQPQIITTLLNNDAKFPYLKKDEYEVALTLKTKGGLELISFDDLYYNFKSLDVDVKGYTTFFSSQSAGLSHSAFVSSTKQQLAYKDFEHIEKLDLEEMHLKWQMAMLSVRVHKFEQKAGRKINFNKKESTRFNKKKVRCYKCQQRGHFARECQAKGGNDKHRYSSFKIKEIGKKEEDTKALITVDTLVDWTDHESERNRVIAAKEFGMIAGSDFEDLIKAGAAKIYNLITGADTKKANTADDAREFALMGIASEMSKDTLHFPQANLQDQAILHLLVAPVLAKRCHMEIVQVILQLIPTLFNQTLRLEQQLAYEDFEQIEKLDLKEMHLKWKMAMLSVRVHKFEQNARRKIDFDKKESTRFNKKKVRCYKCQQKGHFAIECQAKGGNNKHRYSSFKIKEIGKKEEDTKALITVDTLVDWTDHDSKRKRVIAAKEFGMIASCDFEDSIEEGAAKIYNLITRAEIEEANTTDDAREFALMGIASKVHNCPFGCDNKTGKVNIPPARPQTVHTGKPKVFSPVPAGRQHKPFLVPTDRGYSSSVSSFWWKSTARPMAYFSRPTSSYFHTYTPYVPTMSYTHMKYGGDRWVTAVKPSA